METIIINTAANITYSGFTYNTRLRVEYKHTGKQYKTGKKLTENIEIAEKWRNEGKKVKETDGYYFISRLAIPIVLNNGKKDWWYINNGGDYYQINKVSKYGKKMHKLLSKNILPNQLTN